MESCYIPNNPQFGLSLEYTAYNGANGYSDTLAPYTQNNEQPTSDGVLCCSGLLQDCGTCHLQCTDAGIGDLTSCNTDLDDFSAKLNPYDSRLGDCDVQGGSLNECEPERLVDCAQRLDVEECHLRDCDHLRQCSNHLDECEDRLDCGNELGECVVDAAATTVNEQEQAQSNCWSTEDMGSFSLPPLDLDPLPGLFPFSPCPTSYKGEFKEKQPHEVADVLLSLKHAVVHPGAELAPPYSQQDVPIHSQMVMSGPSCYETCGPSVFPTMSVNVSMNMTMHGYPPDQMCPQMQWGQNPPASPMNMMYSQNQGMLSPSPYPGSATYSFTADFRTPNQSDPLITATSSFKPIQISSQKSSQNLQNYNLFGQKPMQSNFTNLGQKQINFNNGNTSQMKTRSSSKLQLSSEHINNGSAPTYQILGQNQNHVNQLGFQQHVGNGLNLQSGISPVGGKVQIGSLSGCSESEDEQKPNLCRICGKTYARPSTLKTHLRTHSGERPYRCSDCNKSFSQAANLTAHVRTHTGQKPFRCPICDRRFSQSSSVTTHMRTHSGERPYRCRACKKAFSDSSTLTKHLRIHSGEKPYQCKLCLLRFSQSGNLNRHMRVHGNNGSILG